MAASLSMPDGEARLQTAKLLGLDYPWRPLPYLSANASGTAVISGVAGFPASDDRLTVRVGSASPVLRSENLPIAANTIIVRNAITDDQMVRADIARALKMR